jgi:DNA-directed RNA polymerase subunit L
MELIVIEEAKDKLIVDIQGMDHTFCNNLKKELYSDPAVQEATYSIKHPLIGTPRFLVHTDGKKAPKAAIKDALKRIKEQNKEFLTAFKKK